MQSEPITVLPVIIVQGNILVPSPIVASGEIITPSAQGISTPQRICFSSIRLRAISLTSVRFLRLFSPEIISGVSAIEIQPFSANYAAADHSFTVVKHNGLTGGNSSLRLVKFNCHCAVACLINSCGSLFLAVSCFCGNSQR